MNKVQVAQATAALRGRGAALVPTGLGYALATTPNPEGVLRAAAMLAEKGIRTPPVLALARALDLPSLLSAPPPRRLQRAMDHCWPGPLGLLLPARRTLPFPLLVDRSALLWMPSEPELLELAYRLQTAIALWPIPDLSGAPAPTLACAVDRLAQTGFEAVIGRTEPIVPGALTVIAPTPTGLLLVREGDLPTANLETLVGPLERPLPSAHS